MNRKLVYAANILSTIPAAAVIPLVPFIYILIDGEGRIPGYFHENLLRFFMVAYPLSLIACLVISIRLLRSDRVSRAFQVAIVPLLVFGCLLLTFLYGGIKLL